MRQWVGNWGSRCHEAAGGVGGGDSRGVELAECCKHAVGVCNKGKEARENECVSCCLIDDCMNICEGVHEYV